MMDIPEQKNVHYPINYGCCNNTLIDMDTYDCCLEDKRRNVKEHTIRKGDICCGNCKLLFEHSHGHRMSKQCCVNLNMSWCIDINTMLFSCPVQAGIYFHNIKIPWAPMKIYHNFWKIFIYKIFLTMFHLAWCHW